MVYFIDFLALPQGIIHYLQGQFNLDYWAKHLESIVLGFLQTKISDDHSYGHIIGITKCKSEVSAEWDADLFVLLVA